MVDLDTYAGDWQFILDRWPSEKVGPDEHTHLLPDSSCYYNHDHKGGREPHVHPHKPCENCPGA